MSARPFASPVERLGRGALRVLVGAGFLFLLAPIVAVIPLSFNGGDFLSYPLRGVSLQWYARVFEPFPWMTGLANSLTVASATTVLATVVGTLAAYGLATSDFRGRGLVMGLMISPMLVPLVITGLAIYLAFARYGLVHTFVGLILAHTILALPFVVVTVTATLQGFDRNMMRAASSLGASPLTAFRTVTMPLIAPGILSGAVFAFVTSFDEVVVALFLAGPGQFTLPRHMFTALRDKLDPSIVALATLLILVSILLLIVVELLRWRSERLRRGRP